MTYQTFEESIEGGRPIELYKFTIGLTIYRYTSAEDTVTPAFDPTPYLSRQIDRNNPNVSNVDRNQELEVTLPADDDLSRRFMTSTPGPEVDLTITRFHRGDTEAYVIWRGKIVSTSFTQNANVCKMAGSTAERTFNKPIPRFRYQSLCNHVLYDQNCTVVRTSYEYSGTVTAASGNEVTINNLALQGPTWAVGGYINIDDTDYRMVLDQSGDVVTVLLPFDEAVIGKTAKVYAGCDHTIAECNGKFSNAVNYGGFPFVPKINPFEEGL